MTEPALTAPLWTGQDPGNRRFAVCLLLSLAIEGSIMLALLPAGRTHRLPPADRVMRISITIATPPAPKPLPLPPAPMPPAPPTPRPTPDLPMPPVPPPARSPVRPVVARPRPIRRLTVPRRQAVTHASPKPLIAQPIVPSATMPPKPPAAPAGGAPSVATGGRLSAFAAACRRAVQEALIYPAAARMDGEQGRVVVGFVYENGLASHARVVVSSHLPMLDAAAIATVEATRFPPPPPRYADRSLNIQTVVIFRFEDADDDH